MAVTSGTATFTATDTASITWATALSSNPPKLLGATATPTDSMGPVAITAISATNVGATVNVSAPFTGSVTVEASD